MEGMDESFQSLQEDSKQKPARAPSRTVPCFQSLQEDSKPSLSEAAREPKSCFQSLQEDSKHLPHFFLRGKILGFQSLQEDSKPAGRSVRARCTRVSNPYRKILSVDAREDSLGAWLVSNPYRKILSPYKPGL